MKTKLILEVSVDMDNCGWIWDSVSGKKEINGVLVEKISMRKDTKPTKITYTEYLDMQEEGYEVNK